MDKNGRDPEPACRSRIRIDSFCENLVTNDFFPAKKDIPSTSWTFRKFLMKIIILKIFSDLRRPHRKILLKIFLNVIHVTLA